MEYIIFYIFAILATLSSIMVIRSENPVHSVLFLVLVFFNTAGLLLLLEVEFLAMLFIIVYVGAIAVLFLFVVMMLDIKTKHNSAELFKYLPVGALIGSTFMFQVYTLICHNTNMDPSSDLNLVMGEKYIDWSTKAVQITNIEVLGQIMYTHYFVWFLVAGFILLVAMIGAIVLTVQVQSNVRRQQVFQQVSRDFESAVFLTTKSEK